MVTGERLGMGLPAGNYLVQPFVQHFLNSIQSYSCEVYTNLDGTLGSSH